MFCLTATAQKNVSLDRIETQWQTKNIKVNGGARPGIIPLVTAFQQTWPTYSGGELLKFSKSKVHYDNTDKVVDLKNGFVRYSEDSPDAESDEGMESCVWRRQNGHSLLAVTFYRMTPSEKVVLCFYDYDPKTQTLVPENSLAHLFTPSFPGYRYRVYLPQNGKNLVISEYFGAITIEHTYAWNGMKPARPQERLKELANCQAQFDQNYSTYGEHFLTQYALVDIDSDGVPELWMQTDDGSYQAVFSIRLTIDLLRGQDDRRTLSFYKNAVGDSGTCGALCMSSNYVVLKESCRHSQLMELSEWDNQADDYGDSTYTLDGKAISKAEGERFVKSLGGPRTLSPKWKKLKTED
ncbi:MAG: hypothetical protein J5637_01300 [Prevotella sp.]|nr:hypothetical protein [Prevotella sp.]